MSDIATTATIRINGQDEPLIEPTLDALVVARGISDNARGLAVARNGAVVPRAKWPDTRLEPGDQVEIVLARQGG